MSAPASDDWEGGPRRRWPLVVGLVGAVAVTGLLARSDFGGGTDSDALRIEEEAGDTLDDDGGEIAEALAGDADPPAAGGRWRNHGDAPVDMPAEHAAVWAGPRQPEPGGYGELLVWGGAGEVAAFDPTGARWRPVPSPPIGDRVAPALVWTGREVFAWGGDAADGRGPLADGARYSPAADVWREVADAPLPPLADPVTAWTGIGRSAAWERRGEVLVVGVEGFGDGEGGLVRAAAYDPWTDRWRALPDPPVRATRGPVDAIWAPLPVRHARGLLLVWGTERRHAAGDAHDDRAFLVAYDPMMDRWTRRPSPPFGNPADGVAVWMGPTDPATADEFLLWGVSEPDPHHQTLQAVGARTDIGGHDGWQSLPAAPHLKRLGDPGRVHGLAAAWTGERMLVHGGSPQSLALAYDPAGDRWETLPAGAGTRVNAAGAWTGESWLLWGGYTPTGPALDLVEWRPDLRRAGRDDRAPCRSCLP